MQPLVPLVFHSLPSLHPPSFRRNDFLYLFYRFLTVPNAPSTIEVQKNRFVYIYMQLSFASPHRYDATLLTSTLLLLLFETHTRKRCRNEKQKSVRTNSLLDCIPSPTEGLRAPGPTDDPHSSVAMDKTQYITL